jgi:hypothetical protein
MNPTYKLIKVGRYVDPTCLSYKFTGNLLIGFGLTELISEVVFAFFLDALTINLLAVIAIGLGCSVRSGSRNSAYWALTIMGLYLAALIPLAVAGIVRPEWYRTGHRAVSSGAFPYVFALVIAALLWVIVNMTLLVRLLIISRRKSD